MFSKHPSTLNGQSGQALVEWLFLFPLYVVWIVGVLAFAQWFLIHQQLLTAAREAALLYSSGRMEKQMVLAYTQRSLQNSFPRLSVPPSNIHIGRSENQPNNFRLDEVKIIFQPRAHSLLRLFFKYPLEESCVIRHAPTYYNFIAIPSGPPVPW